MDKRDLIIFKEKYNEEQYCLGGIRNFKDLTLNGLQELLDNGFIDLDEAQNDGLTVQQFLDFVKDCELDKVKFLGYAVSKDRPDCRVTIDGMHAITNLDKEEFLDKSTKYREHADMFEYSLERSDVLIWFD